MVSLLYSILAKCVFSSPEPSILLNLSLTQCKSYIFVQIHDIYPLGHLREGASNLY